MPPTVIPSRPVPAARLIHEVDAEEPLPLFLAAVDTPGDLPAALAAVRQRRPRSFSVVAHLSPPTPAGWEEMLSEYARMIPRLVLTGPDGADLAQLLAREYEPDAYRAVVGVMTSLRPGDAFLLLWPGRMDIDQARYLIAHGLRWRATWEAPEEGEFHSLPPA